MGLSGPTGDRFVVSDRGEARQVPSTRTRQGSDLKEDVLDLHSGDESILVLVGLLEKSFVPAVSVCMVLAFYSDV